MRRPVGLWLVALLGLVAVVSLARIGESGPAIRLETRTRLSVPIRKLFSDQEIALLEKLNRADREHLGHLKILAVPERWDLGELAYSPLPQQYEAARSQNKALVVHVSGQVFGAYEQGRLVRWGPVSSGVAHCPTPQGLYHLNWKSSGRNSTVDARWYMPWYFNFDNRRGMAFHAYALPGKPASHRCIRLLERDAAWLFEWGEQWKLAPDGGRLLRSGTQVLIVGAYLYDMPPPWQSIGWWNKTLELPPLGLVPTMQ